MKDLISLFYVVGTAGGSDEGKERPREGEGGREGMALICLISTSCGGDYNICKEVELHSQLDSTLPFSCDDCFVYISSKLNNSSYYRTFETPY